MVAVGQFHGFNEEDVDFDVGIYYVNDYGIEICNATSYHDDLDNGCTDELPTAISISREHLRNVSAQTENNMD